MRIINAFAKRIGVLLTAAGVASVAFSAANFHEQAHRGMSAPIHTASLTGVSLDTTAWD